MVAYFEDEPAGEQVADPIADAQESSASLAMSVVNAGELCVATCCGGFELLSVRSFKFT